MKKLKLSVETGQVQTYAEREGARQDVFNYIEMFYNPKRRHSFNNGLSPVDFERQYFERLASV